MAPSARTILPALHQTVFRRLETNVVILQPAKIHTTICISMECAMQVAKWGNSLAVRLPAAVVEALELREGDDIEIQVASARAFAVSRDRSRERALERLRALGKTLPDGWVFDRGAANTR
jgi:antitoxin MazE